MRSPRSFRAYGARKRALGVVDLDDLLLYWRALAADEVIGARMAGAFDHVLVDEYQDVNGLQVEIVRSLRRRRPGLTVVGDDFQAIYGFRAASAVTSSTFPASSPTPTRSSSSATTVRAGRSSRSQTPSRSRIGLGIRSGCGRRARAAQRAGARVPAR